jgi:glutamyl-tRNA synthetase
MLRVRFAPSPTGYLHIGSARTFIFNWLYARKHGGTMILRIDDTDVERNTDASLQSIYDGLNWLGLSWDENYRQSERLELHQKMAWQIFEKGHAYRDFTAATGGEDAASADSKTAWLFNAGMRELTREESDRRAQAGEPFVLRYRVPRGPDRPVKFHDAVFGEQEKTTADIEDFALLRSSGIPTYHMASCADDADLRISHIIRGQDHLTNSYKHVLIFEALGVTPPIFAHLPLLIAPDGAKLSKRKHGPVVSVTTYRDAGFLPHAYINFLCLLGWSPKDDSEVLSREELIAKFSLEGVNRSNAVVNFSEADPIDPKALWLNGQQMRLLPMETLAKELMPWAEAAGMHPTPERMLQVTPLIRERVHTLKDVATQGDIFFLDELAPYDPAELIPQKGDLAMAKVALESAKDLLAGVQFSHDPLKAALEGGAAALKIKNGQMYQPIRVAVCGRKNAPGLFETLEVVGRDACLKRIGVALDLLAKTS